MQQILYQNYKEDKGSFKRTLKSKEVERAVTLHPVKDPIYQYRIFNYFRSVNIMKYRQRQVRVFSLLLLSFLKTVTFVLHFCLSVYSVYCSNY